MKKNARLQIGMIGVAGRGGLWHHWNEPNARSVVVAGADVNSAYLETFRTDHGRDPFITTDYREMLARPDLDAVAVCSPDFCHEEHTIAALEAGKHVFCEKPMAITIAGCDRMLKAWKKSRKQFMIGFNMRYMNIFRVMKEIIESGVIGEIKAVWVRHFVGYGGYFYFHDWHGTKKNCTSLLLQKGSHDIDMIHWLTGRYTKRVSAFGSLDLYGGAKPNSLTCPECDERTSCNEASEDGLIQCAFRKEIDIEDNQVMIMELEGGIKAAYLQCHFTPDYHRNYTFIGTEGRIENSEPEMKVWLKTRVSNTWRELADRTYDIKPARGGHGGADPVICRDFVDMCIDGAQPLAPPIAGRMSVAAGCCGAESIRNGGKPVNVPPPPLTIKGKR